MSNHKRNAIKPPDGKTRICLDPWNKAFIRADGQVCLCCNAKPVGDLNVDNLDDIINGEKAKEYRAGLLTGKLHQDCVTCPDKPVGEIFELRKLVKEIVDQ